MALGNRDFVLTLNFKYEFRENKVKIHRLEAVKLKLNPKFGEHVQIPKNIIKNVTRENGMQIYEINTEDKIALSYLKLCNETISKNSNELKDQNDKNDNNCNTGTNNNKDLNLNPSPSTSLTSPLLKTNSKVPTSTTTASTENNTNINNDNNNINNTSDSNNSNINSNDNNNNKKNDISLICNNELINETKLNNNNNNNNIENNKKRIKGYDKKSSPKKVRRPSSDTTDGGFSDSDHEEEFYYTEIEENEGKAPSPPSPPTLSHRDMARPPHEDPEYQRQIVGNFRQGLLALSQSNSSKNVITYNINNVGPINIPTSPLAHHNYTWNSPVSPVKHARWSPRPSTSSAPYPSPNYIHHHYNNNNIGNQHQQTQQSGLTTITQNAANINTLSQSVPPSPSNISSLTTAATLSPNVHHPSQQQYHQQQQTHRAQHLPTPQQHLQQQTNVQTTAVVTTVTAPTTTTTNHRSPQSPNRRTRGDNKKCRKVYGMDNKDQWCTQCRWKKACSRFGD